LGGGESQKQRRKTVKHKSILAVLLFCLTLTPIAGAQSGLVMYDNFNQRFLNPSKWLISSPCFTWTVLECAREIQDGHLRLEVRGYGATNSNTGNQYGESELHFLNPNRVKGIATQLVVRRTSAANCAASTDFNSGTQAILQGNFFNSGSGVPSDDVQALLFFNHLPTDPAGVLSVIAVLNWQGQFFGGVGLGTINVGQRINAQLIWDKKNHQFMASWTDLASGIVSQSSLPYTIPDTTPAAFADKLLGVRVFTPNCIGTQLMVDDVEATFDNVMVTGFDN
jgi:hypothetical protein